MYAHERSLVKKLADQPFAIIGVNSDEDLATIQRVVQEKNITWRSFWNGPKGIHGPISTAWNVSAWPTIFVIDAEGRIRYKHEQSTGLDKALTKLFGEMGLEVDLSNHD